VGLGLFFASVVSVLHCTAQHPVRVSRRLCWHCFVHVCLGERERERERERGYAGQEWHRKFFETQGFYFVTAIELECVVCASRECGWSARPGQATKQQREHAERAERIHDPMFSKCETNNEKRAKQVQGAPSSAISGQQRRDSQRQ